MRDLEVEGEEKASRLAFGSLPRDIPFIYSAFNQLYKVEPGIWDTWMDGAPAFPRPLPPKLPLPAPASKPLGCLRPTPSSRAAAAHARSQISRPPVDCEAFVCAQLQAYTRWGCL